MNEPFAGYHEHAGHYADFSVMRKGKAEMGNGQKWPRAKTPEHPCR